MKKQVNDELARIVEREQKKICDFKEKERLEKVKATDLANKKPAWGSAIPKATV